jgi:hypothetical protein
MTPDFKNDLGRNGDARILPCWTASGLFFLHLPILIFLSRLGRTELFCARVCTISSQFFDDLQALYEGVDRPVHSP